MPTAEKLPTNVQVNQNLADIVQVNPQREKNGRQKEIIKGDAIGAKKAAFVETNQGHCLPVKHGNGRVEAKEFGVQVRARLSIAASVLSRDFYARLARGVPRLQLAVHLLLSACNLSA